MSYDFFFNFLSVFLWIEIFMLFAVWNIRLMRSHFHESACDTGLENPPAALFRQRNWPRDRLLAAVYSSTFIFHFVVLDDPTLSHSASCRSIEKFSTTHLKKKEGMANTEGQRPLKELSIRGYGRLKNCRESVAEDEAESNIGYLPFQCNKSQLWVRSRMVLLPWLWAQVWTTWSLNMDQSDVSRLSLPADTSFTWPSLLKKDMKVNGFETWKEDESGMICDSHLS